MLPGNHSRNDINKPPGRPGEQKDVSVGHRKLFGVN